MKGTNPRERWEEQIDKLLLATFDPEPVKGFLLRKTRPCLVVSPYKMNKKL
jgi:mRNA-degrading endonuclease toxin of MazEF toxin-antitoxin module